TSRSRNSSPRWPPIPSISTCTPSALATAKSAAGWFPRPKRAAAALAPFSRAPMTAPNTRSAFMTRVAFIGLGNMGSGMAANQAKAGREVVAFDLSADAMARAKEQGMSGAGSAAEAVNDADIVITMLPAGQHVREIYEQAILPNARKDALLIDCSTI